MFMFGSAIAAAVLSVIAIHADHWGNGTCGCGGRDNNTGCNRRNGCSGRSSGCGCRGNTDDDCGCGCGRG
ncbi:MAG: hypothetical protein IJR90_01550 [Clostridia bacterium]|nr:hypothetical protein [Clostridia bacterium]